MMFIRRGIIKRCVPARRPKHRYGETLIITTAIQIVWVEWPAGPRGTGGGEVKGGGKVTFCGWINIVSPLCCLCCAAALLWICLRWLESTQRVCVVGGGMPVCVHVRGLDLAVILTPLWVNRKKEQLMKNAECITLEEKFFSPLT